MQGFAQKDSPGCSCVWNSLFWNSHILIGSQFLPLTLQAKLQYCCFFDFKESWLSIRVRLAIQLAGLTAHRATRAAALSGWTSGGGLHVDTNKEWCRNAVVSALVEFMIVNTQPFTPLCLLSQCTSHLMLIQEKRWINPRAVSNPDNATRTIFLVAGDFEI